MNVKNVNYATDPLGKTKLSWLLGDDPDVDHGSVRIGGIGFQASVVCLIKTELLGTIRLVIKCSPKGIALRSFAVTEAPKGRTVTPALLERAAEELRGMVRQAVVGSRDSIEWEGEPVTRGRVLEVVHAAMMPQRGSGESASAFVYRMWRTEYEPYGLTQKDLARDLGRSYDLIREYVSKESRRAAAGPRNIAEAISRKRQAQGRAQGKRESE
jgi:hypothetical protein